MSQTRTKANAASHLAPKLFARVINTSLVNLPNEMHTHLSQFLESRMILILAMSCSRLHPIYHSIMWEQRFLPELLQTIIDGNNKKTAKMRACIPKEIYQEGIVSLLDNNSNPDLPKFYWRCIYNPLSWKQQLLPTFLQAVIDSDHDKMKQMLEHNPALSLLSPDNTLTIQSKYTWQTFYAEPAFVMAAKRNQIASIKIMMAYCKRLPQTKSINTTIRNALSVLKSYNTFINDEIGIDILIPQAVTQYAQSLIEVCRQETFAQNPKKLSKQTMFALNNLFEKLIPQKAIKLDEFIDPEIYLLAFYKSYEINEHLLTNEQCELFDKRVIGLAQSAVSPETAAVLSTGEINFSAGKYVMVNKRNSFQYYRSNPDVRTGHGFDTVRVIYIEPLEDIGDATMSILQNYLIQKNKKILKIQSTRQNQDMHAKPGCSIS